MKTREDIFKAINIEIAEIERAGIGPAFTPDTPEVYAHIAAHYVMAAERSIKNRARGFRESPESV